jgi:pilus assembly protein CpaF
MLDPDTRQRMLNRILCSFGENTHDDDSLRRLIFLTVAEEYAGSRLTFQERKEIAGQLFNAMRGLDILQPLMDDPLITEIMVNGPDTIFFEKDGNIQPSVLRFNDTCHLSGVITNFFGRANRMIHEKKPLADMRLPSGARVHAALPPAAPDGPVLTIRKFAGLRPDMDALIDDGFITVEAADFLKDAVRNKRTLFICGGTGTGKTTFLNILSGYIPSAERIVTIEDSAELSLQGLPNLVRLEARPPGPDGDGEIGLNDLIRASLRMRPDRIVVGEVRGREAFDMLQAMNTGHPGSLSTGHGNSCQDMLARLSLMVLMAVQLPLDAIRGLISSALDIVVHLSRTSSGKRQVSEICQIIAGGTDQFILSVQYRRSKGGELLHVEEFHK